MQFGFRCSEGGHRFRDALTEAKIAESAGFDSVWTAEHHGWETFWPSSHVALAGIAARTGLQVGTCISLLTEANPIRLAGEANLLDVISDGGFALGVGLGWRRQEMENLGYDFEQRGPRMTDHLRAMRSLWRSDPATYDGRFVSFDEFSLSPPPIQQPGPPVLVGGASDQALRRAARLGDGWLPSWMPPVDQLAERYRTYERYLADADSDERMRPLLRLTSVDEDPAVAMRRCREIFETLVDGYSTESDGDAAFLTAEQRRHVEDDFESFASDRFLVGTPEDVAEGVETLRDQLGVDHVLFKLYNPGVSHEEVCEQLQLLGDETLPYVSN